MAMFNYCNEQIKLDQSMVLEATDEQVLALRLVTDTHCKQLRSALFSGFHQVLMNFILGTQSAEYSPGAMIQNDLSIVPEIVFSIHQSDASNASSVALPEKFDFDEERQMLCGVLRRPHLPFGEVPALFHAHPDVVFQWTQQGIDWLINSMAYTEINQPKHLSAKALTDECAISLLEMFVMHVAEQFSVQAAFDVELSGLDLRWTQFKTICDLETIFVSPECVEPMLSRFSKPFTGIHWLVVVDSNGEQVPIIKGYAGAHFLDAQNPVYASVSDETQATQSNQKLSILSSDFWHAGNIRLELFLGENEVRIDEILNLDIGDVLMLNQLDCNSVSLRTTKSMVEVAKTKLILDENSSTALKVQIVSKR